MSFGSTHPTPSSSSQAGSASDPRAASGEPAGPSGPANPDAPRSSLDRLVFPGLLLLLTLLAYRPVITDGGYIWDDDAYITNNPVLRDLEGLRQIWLVPTATPQYYPLVHTTFWAEYQLWGLDPMGYHLVNVVIHALVAVFLWRVLVALGLRSGVAWVAAAVFAVHPVHVESVAWITERKNTLSGLFYMLAFLAYLKFEPALPREQLTAPRPSRWAWYAVAFLLFIAALLSKTVTCSLPAAVLLVLWWKRGWLKWREILPTVPFFILGAALGLKTAWLEKVHVGAMGSDWDLSFLQRLLIAGRAVAFYAGKLLWPENLSFIYTRWTVSPAILWQWLFPLGVLAAFALFWRMQSRWGRGPITALFLFVGTLFPALGFFNIYPMRYSFVADHFQYLASISLLTLATVAVAGAMQRLGPKVERFGPVLAAWVLLGLSVLTFSQSKIYFNEETLWSDTIRKNPTGWIAWNNLGTYYLREGRVEDALPLFTQVTKFFPDLSEGHINVGSALLLLGQTEPATVSLQRALELEPNSFLAHWGMARTMRAEGELEQAVRHYHQIFSATPAPNDGSRVEAQRELAVVYLRLGQDAHAVRQLRDAVQRLPDRADLLEALAWLLATSHDSAVRNGVDAVKFAEQAVELTPQPRTSLLDTLAAAYARMGRFKDAIQTAEQAVEQANAGNDFELSRSIRARLERYKARQPYQESGPYTAPH